VAISDVLFRDLKTCVERHDKDLYHGNGKPGLTTRMAMMEDTMRKLSENLKWIVRLLIGTLITGVATMIIMLVVKK
jgi:hypothetical protein